MTTSSEETKGIDEVKTFELFIERTQMPVDLSSIEKRKPPEPDLLCKHEAEGLIAFELTNLCDPNLAKVVAAGSRAREDAFSTSSPTADIVRNKLKKKYETSYPIELLIYKDGPIIDTDDMVIPTIKPIFESNNGPFQRVWFMGENTTCLIWENS